MCLLPEKYRVESDAAYNRLSLQEKIAEVINRLSDDERIPRHLQGLSPLVAEMAAENERLTRRLAEIEGGDGK